MKRTLAGVVAAAIVLGGAMGGFEPLRAQDEPQGKPPQGPPPQQGPPPPGLLPVGTPTQGQPPPGPPPTVQPVQGVPVQRGPATPLIPLKVVLVVSRFTGEKKISSLPYTLFVTANDNKRTSLRMGVEVPMRGGGYRQVGTNIDCTAMSVERVPDGRFRVSLTVNDTAVLFDPKGTAQATNAAGIPPGGFGEAPAFRNFTSDFSIILRDGQTAQYTTATDPVSGEVMKVDVTLSLLK